MLIDVTVMVTAASLVSLSFGQLQMRESCLSIMTDGMVEPVVARVIFIHLG